MSGNHPTREEDFDLYALGALDGDEKVAFESHLASCADCKVKLADSHGRMALLAFSAPTVQPSPHVKEQLLRQLALTSPGRNTAPVQLKPEREEGVFARWWGILLPLAGAFALASVLLWLHNETLERQVAELRSTIIEQQAQLSQARDVAEMMSARDTVVVSLAEQKNQPEGTARVIYNSRRGLLVYNGHLAPTTPDKSYQLWLVPASGAPISAGVFNPSNGETNSIVAKVPPGTAAKAFAVTLEPAGGKPSPTGPMILVGPVS
ncbi:MAG TPA: anti-sigma factor [Candidatus Acidoferrales bacterium]